MTSSVWNEVLAAIQSAPYPVEVLPVDPARAQECLGELSITTRSWLGAVIANAGGILVDHGWLRVLGSGTRDLPDVVVASRTGTVTVGYDVLGGEFAWVPAQPGLPPTIHYLGPGAEVWQDLECGYSDWLHSMVCGATSSFYEGLRWPGWQAQTTGLGLTERVQRGS